MRETRRPAISRSPLFAVAVAIVVAIVALFVFLDVADVFRLGHPVSSTTYASKAELVKDWDKSAPWLPGDATGIQVKEVKQYGPGFDPAILRAISRSALNPALCAQTSRLTSPALTASWAPDADVPKVYACGDWDVIPTPDGWFGWTKNGPQEQAAAAALLKSRKPAGGWNSGTHQTGANWPGAEIQCAGTRLR
jgi:hypothetical protein